MADKAGRSETMSTLTLVIIIVVLFLRATRTAMLI